MTIDDKRKALQRYCLSRRSGCVGCQAVPDHVGNCFSGSDAHMLENYNRVFGEDDENPYWKRICAMAERQRAKGLATYGQGLENNPADILKRLEHLQEELIDGLMYCEWIKEKILEIAPDIGKDVTE